jgi:hypothetical protein
MVGHLSFPRSSLSFALIASLAILPAAGCSGGGSGGGSTSDASTSGSNSTDGGAIGNAADGTLPPGNDGGASGGGEGGGGGASDSGVDAGPLPPVYPLTLNPLSRAQTSTANIQLFFNVTDALGRGVPNLVCQSSVTGAADAGPCDFEYLEDGQPLDPTESAFDVGPVAGNALNFQTVLVLQTSPSIITNNELPQLKTAANLIIQQIIGPNQTNHSMEILTFADQPTPTIRIPFSSDPAALMATVNAISEPDGTSTNLYGTLDYALGLWTDQFDTLVPGGQLTAGLLIVITNGRDNAARDTLASVIQTRGNKRVITVGVGTDATLDTCALQSIGNVLAFTRPTYQDLVNDISSVTSAIDTLGHSIYTASYCSPKRAAASGSSMHSLTFTVKGNDPYNATCQNATFTSNQNLVCAANALTDASTVAASTTGATCGNDAGVSASVANTMTCGTSNVTGQVECCPPTLPYSCPGVGCFGTAAAAAAQCSTSCTLCGGSGAGSAQDNELVAGTQLVVPFDSTGYASGQCPALWMQQCQALDTCCGSLPTGSTFAQSCASALNSALGNETTCAANQPLYCPTTPNCAAFKSCCGALDAGSSEQSSCYSALTSAISGTQATTTLGDGGTSGPEALCATDIPEYGSYNSVACPLGPNCAQLSTCCAALPGSDGGSSTQSNCQSQLLRANGSEAACQQITPQYGAYNATACPLGPECSQLSSCCAAIAGTAGGTSCTSTLTNAAGSETTCQAAIPTFGTYNATACPLGPECSTLNTCCASLSGTAQTTCTASLTSARGSESVCGSDLTTYSTNAACRGPNCTAMANCCATYSGAAATYCQSLMNDISESTCSLYTTELCPTGPNCTALKTCCSTFQSTSAAEDCIEILTDNSESYCSSYLPEYCPTGPNCTALKACCEAPGQTAAANCESYLTAADGNESSCRSYLADFTCPGDAGAL